MEREERLLLAEVGKRIKELRAKRGLTMAGLAEAADLSNQYLSEIERGQKSMTLLKLRRLALALNVSTDFLVFGRKGDAGTPEGAAAEMIRLMEEIPPLEREMALRTMETLTPMLRAMGPERD